MLSILMCIQKLVKLCQFILKIFSGNVKTTSEVTQCNRALTRILKIGVRMLPSRKSWSFSIHFYWYFSKSWSQIQKVGVKNSIFGVNESSECKGPHNVTRLFLSFFQYLIKLHRGLLEGIPVYQVLSDLTVKLKARIYEV